MGLSDQDRETKRRLPELLAARRRLRQRPMVPHAGPYEGEQASASGKSGTLRAAIFGMNDGLVSNGALIMGFAGADQARGVILLAGISGLLAGAFSMGAGEYISMRVQREVLERMLHLEAHELHGDPEVERRELSEIYRAKGLSPELSDEVATELMRDPATALDTHAREELGIDPQEGLGSPWGAAVSSFLMFCIGAVIPLIPFLFASGSTVTLLAAGITGLALLVMGALSSRLTARSLWWSSFRQFAIGMSAALVTYAVGRLVGVSVAG
ncbi:MAG: VIT1/CCC1 transporter family protein [Planctomycetaceae bacterium]